MESVGYQKEKNRHNVFNKLKCYLSVRIRAKSGRPRVAPTGCFSVCVGPEKERFVVKTEFANHPLFKMLLEDAESEYGFMNEGPLHLPCDVDLFCRVLAEMDGDNEFEANYDPRCSFAYGACSPFSPARFGRCGHDNMYNRLTPPRLLKMNHF